MTPARVRLGTTVATNALPSGVARRRRCSRTRASRAQFDVGTQERPAPSSLEIERPPRL
ncbi:MAG: hypothetical protein R3E53_10515 [Myxococcota bacterium]